MNTSFGKKLKIVLKLKSAKYIKRFQEIKLSTPILIRNLYLFPVFLIEISLIFVFHKKSDN